MDWKSRIDAMQQRVSTEPDMPMTGAERVAKHRALKRAASPPQHCEPVSKPDRSLFSTADFIAIDGEGVSEGPATAYRVGPEKRLYHGQPHYMILLAASTGAEISCSTGRLGLVECLDFLLSVASENPRSLLVCYSGSYDINQILLYDLPSNLLRAIGRGSSVTFTLNNKAYKLQYRARKSLQVWRYATPTITGTLNAQGILVEQPPECSFTLWDTIGFFQSSFVVTLEKWLGKDYPDLAFIRRMKDDRSLFQRSRLPEMTEYNQAECRALVAVMDKLRESIERLDLSLSRWDGAGAIAGAMNKKHNTKQHMQASPEPVFHASRCAFSGGHIEVCQFGTFNKLVHHYDVNSAYPSIIRSLPSLAGAEWEHGSDFDPPPGFTLVRLRYAFTAKLPFYPLFFRTPEGSIIYPQYGEGWFWYPEFLVARGFYIEFGGDDFEVLEWWHCIPATDAQPFDFVDKYYAMRATMSARIKAGDLSALDQWMKGAEKVIKLGLNSLYGKMAQQVGGRDGKPPSYFQLEWAGYVTSAVRAQLMQAAMQAPSSIISFATDGLFSLSPLSLPCPKEKVLGQWEYTPEGGMLVAMPGVYWLFDANSDCSKVKVDGAHSRGFDKDAVSTPDLIVQKWRENKYSVDIPTKRLVTIGSACTSDKHDASMWLARGRFLFGARRLDISGASQKRDAPLKPSRLWERSIKTLPRANVSYLDWYCDSKDSLDIRAQSAPYVIRWLDGISSQEDFHAGAIEIAEMMDADDDLW